MTASQQEWVQELLWPVSREAQWGMEELSHGARHRFHMPEIKNNTLMKGTVQTQIVQMPRVWSCHA